MDVFMNVLEMLMEGFDQFMLVVVFDVVMLFIVNIGIFVVQIEEEEVVEEEELEDEEELEEDGDDDDDDGDEDDYDDKVSVWVEIVNFKKQFK